MQPQYANKPDVKARRVFDGNIGLLRRFVVNLEVVEIEPEEISPILALLVEILQVDDRVFTELGMAMQ